jgi:hypothetical protein
MSNIVGSLIVKLSAHTADFVSGMSNAAAKGSSEVRKLAVDITGIVNGPLSKLTSMMLSPKGLGLTGISFAAYEVSELNNKYKEFGRQAANMNLPLNDFLLLQKAAEKGGAGMEQLEVGLRKLMVSIANGGRGGVFEKLGLDEIHLSGMFPSRAFEEVARSIADIKNPMERARLEMDLFGESGAKLDLVLRNLANGGLDQYQKNIASEAAQRGFRFMGGGFGLGTQIGNVWDEVVGNAEYGIGLLTKFYETANKSWGLWGMLAGGAIGGTAGTSLASDSISNAWDKALVDMLDASEDPIQNLGVELNNVADEFAIRLKNGLEESIASTEKEYEKMRSEAFSLTEKFDPLAAYQSAIGQIRTLKDFVSPDVFGAAMADARKTALGKLMGESPAMQSLPEGPEHYSAEAYRAIVDISTQRQDRQMDELKRANASLDGILKAVERQDTYQVAPIP